jgi:hypothetical protein
MLLHENVGRDVVVVIEAEENVGVVLSLTRTLRLTETAPSAEA